MRLLIIPFVLLTLAAPSQMEAQSAGLPVDTRSLAVPTLAPLVTRIAPAVVCIATKGTRAKLAPIFVDPLSGFPDPPFASTDREIVGSGVIIDAVNGLIVTNHHVIEGAVEISITLADQRQFLATLVGADTNTDLAVLRITAAGLIAMPLGDSGNLEVGDYVVAIGNPYGMGQSVTHGIVSALHRKGISGAGFGDFIQTDAAINQGNSGGALANLKGELVGINTANAGPVDRNSGIGFAVPVNIVRAFLSQISKGW